MNALSFLRFVWALTPPLRRAIVELVEAWQAGDETRSRRALEHARVLAFIDAATKRGPRS